MLILMAARQAIDAAMLRRTASIDSPRISPSAISRISKISFSRSETATAAGAAFTAIVLGFKTDGLQLAGDARVLDLLLCGARARSGYAGLGEQHFCGRSNRS